MIKILVDGMPRTVGGIGSLIMNMAEVARERKDDIRFDFIIPDHSAYISVLEAKGYTYFIVPSIGDVKEYRRCVTDLFTEHKYDYLWFNNTSKVNIFLPRLAKRIGGAKLITHTHGVDFEEKGIKRAAFIVLNALHEKEMFSLIDVPLACSEQAADVYYKHDKGLRNKTVVIRNGVFTSRFLFSSENRDRIRAELGLSNDDVLLGAVGRLTKVKNYSFLIDLMNDLPDRYALILLGEGEEHAALQDQIAGSRASGRIHLLGKKDAVNEYYSAMDYFLMPSFNEGMPFSVIEAQTNGLRCIVSDTLTREMAITDLVRFAPLEEKAAWIDLLKEPETKDADRTAYVERIRESGYSIEESYDLFVESIIHSI